MADPASGEAKRKRASSDEHYVIDLCDGILGEKALRQYDKFDWLRGDTGRGLQVDAYWPEHGIVLEYRERQHYEAVTFFDKPDKLTASGIPRSEQRALYDRRRDELIPANGLILVVIRSSGLVSNKAGRLLRDILRDTLVIQRF
ncbi:MAG TPA: hypothetical protein VES60_12500 [Nakamurella sp.]|nr:hypothetical protein [Nakamurella sp.]